MKLFCFVLFVMVVLISGMPKRNAQNDSSSTSPAAGSIGTTKLPELSQKGPQINIAIDLSRVPLNNGVANTSVPPQTKAQAAPPPPVERSVSPASLVAPAVTPAAPPPVVTPAVAAPAPEQPRAAPVSEPAVYAAPAPVIHSAPAPPVEMPAKQPCGCRYKGECLQAQPVQRQVIHYHQPTGLFGRGCRLLHR
jgi:hypothetical protein